MDWMRCLALRLTSSLVLGHLLLPRTAVSSVGLTLVAVTRDLEGCALAAGWTRTVAFLAPDATIPAAVGRCPAVLGRHGWRRVAVGVRYRLVKARKKKNECSVRRRARALLGGPDLLDAKVGAILAFFA
jgi:hypothetical protein